MTEMKRCTKCGAEKPATREFFYGMKGCLHPHCKECFKAQVYARRVADPEHAKDISRRSYANNREQRKEALREQHKKRMADPMKAAVERDRCREKARREREVNRDEVNARTQRYRKRNLEKVRADQRRVKALAYQADPEKFKARTAKQRAQRAGVEGEFNGLDMNAAFRRQNGCCLYCGMKIKWRQTFWEADHFIPLSKGGTNDHSNIVIACRTCNRSKHDKMPWEWMPEKFRPPEQTQ